MEKKIINKGNYSMEPPDREADFNKILASGWEDEYKRYREKWKSFPTNQYVSDYPLLVDLELSTICNLQCPMCYTITKEFKSKVNTGLMDIDLFKKIVDEIAGKVPALRLSLRGEPTLHPQFIECIHYAKKSGISEVSFLTNGSKLSNNYFTEIMHAGADWITVSIDGLNENYESIRRPLKFKDTLQKIKDIKNIKDINKRCKPAIKVQSVWPAIRSDPEKFYNTFFPYVDLIAFNPLIDFNENEEPISNINNFYCPQHYQRLVIGSDGIAMMCANDETCDLPIGDASQQSIYELWHSEKLNNIRKVHKQNNYHSISVCKKCYLPREVDDNETSIVNGRTFVIQNYKK